MTDEASRFVPGKSLSSFKWRWLLLHRLWQKWLKSDGGKSIYEIISSFMELLENNFFTTNFLVLSSSCTVATGKAGLRRELSGNLGRKLFSSRENSSSPKIKVLHHPSCRPHRRNFPNAVGMTTSCCYLKGIRFFSTSILLNVNFVGRRRKSFRSQLRWKKKFQRQVIIRCGDYAMFKAEWNSLRAFFVIHLTEQFSKAFM